MGKVKEIVESIVAQPDVPRKNIQNLGKKLSDRIGVLFTEDQPEYFGLDEILTDEMADICNKMKMRVPYTLDELVKMTGIEKNHLEEVLEEMGFIGIIEWNWENPLHEKKYNLPIFVPGSAEYFNMNEEFLAAHPQEATFFMNMANWPLRPIIGFIPPGGAGIGMHVIPVEKAIHKEDHAIDLEKISYWLDKYDGQIVASPCSCRMSRPYVDEGCGDDFHDWCILLGDVADFCMQTNKADRYITKEEALEICQKAEDNGFVHEITNVDGEEKIFAICNCNPAVCLALKNAGYYNAPNIVRSAYIAKVNPENCVACGQCVQHCPNGAVRLGQKLHTADGKPKAYKHSEIPGATMLWEEDKWNPDWRDTNRVECYPSGTAPCKTACPAHIGIQGYLQLAKEGRYDEALDLIKKDNPFPAVCGRVCNRRCEDACTRGSVDEAIAIDEVKNFLAQRDIDNATRYIPQKIIPSLRGEFEEKVAIIGAGPAGLSCAYFLALKGYRPTVFDKNEKPGGMLVYGIPSYKLEKDVIAAEIDVIKELGVEIKCGVEVGKDVTIQELREQGYKGFYVAIGCQGSRTAGVPGEDAKNVISAVDFLRTVGENEATKVKGNVVVIGGGNVAVDVARTAKRCGAGDVTMVSLEQRDEMPASEEELLEALDDGIKVENGWGPKEIIVKRGKAVGVVLKKCTSVFDADHKFAPQYDEDDTMTIDCDNVYLSIGQSIVWGDLLKDTKVEFGRGNGPVADAHTYQTAEPDIFVGGDVYTGPKFVIDAIGAGHQAAESLHRYVHDFGCSLTIGRDWRELIELDKDDITLPEYDKTPRQKHGFDPKIDIHTSFRDPKLPFTAEQVQAETQRCLSCGASYVDPNRCIGCGICTTKCKFDAIEIHREIPEASKMDRTEDRLKIIGKEAVKRAIRLQKEKILK